MTSTPHPGAAFCLPACIEKSFCCHCSSDAHHSSQKVALSNCSLIQGHWDQKYKAAHILLLVSQILSRQESKQEDSYFAYLQNANRWVSSALYSLLPTYMTQMMLFPLSDWNRGLDDKKLTEFPSAQGWDDGWVGKVTALTYVSPTDHVHNLQAVFGICKASFAPSYSCKISPQSSLVWPHLHLPGGLPPLPSSTAMALLLGLEPAKLLKQQLIEPVHGSRKSVKIDYICIY